MNSSILITSYNKGAYIEQCILSCINQDFSKGTEIVILDNCSDDNSDRIFNKYKNKIKLFKKERISNYPALNQIDLIKEGLSISTGNIIFLLDGDDYLLKNKVSEVSNLFKKNADLEVIFDVALKNINNEFSQFKIRKKISKDIWPTIINTSSISLKRKFLIDTLEHTFINNYNLLEIDFRINVYSRNIKKNFTIIKEPYTVYRQLENSIMGNIKKYSKTWWQKRKQAHTFMKNIYSNNTMEYKNKLDFLLTSFINKILKF